MSVDKNGLLLRMLKSRDDMLIVKIRHLCI